jgi:hypothetical protein
MSWMPAVAGWEIAEPEVFNPDNLFDRIDGAAPLFLENNFREMTSVDYRKGDDYITIQAYRHASPADAFGMYASERSTELAHLPCIGGEAQGDAENLFFFAGNIYVKMASHSDSPVEQTLQTIAQGLAGRIDPQAAYPVLVKAFPQEGKRPFSETYITSGYIGHDFLRSVYTAAYEKDGQTFQLFILDGESPQGVRNVLKAYFAFTGQSPDFGEGELTIEDRYNGTIPVIWKGRYLMGAYSENGDTAGGAKVLLKQTAEAIH